MTTNLNTQQEWEEYYPKVYGYFFRRLNNRLDVEDLTSIVLTYFLQTISDPEKSGRVQNRNAYLWKIAHNQLATFIRTKSKQVMTVGFDENTDSIDEKLENERSWNFKDRTEKLLHCIEKNLKDLDLQIVKQSLIEDRISSEVATNLNLTAVNVRKRLSRSVTKLRKECQKVWNR
jgi:RNA polymerase sigma factor (sigma-70 family)